MPLFLFALAAPALTDEELGRVRDGFDARRDAYLEGYLNEPFHQMPSGLEACQRGLPEAKWIWHPDEDAVGEAPLWPGG